MVASAILLESACPSSGSATEPHDLGLHGRRRPDPARRSLVDQLLPGFAIFLTVLALNLVGEGLSDALNPRLARAGLTVSPVLAIEGLSLALPAGADRSYAVQNLSLEIEPGETLCIVGESGSGKSMTAHAVMGLLPRAVRPVSGAVRLSGRDLLRLDERALQDVRGREIGMIFQEP
jgi:ABC-type multidrug transport system fused ATPase/permease subunit